MSPPASSTPRRIARRGMTLIELLVVMAIMLTLMGLVANAFQSLGRSTEITNSIQSVANVLNVARQIAVSRNEYTQVRLYAPQSASGDFRAGQYTAMAVYRAESPFYTNAAGYAQLISSGRMRQEGQITRLPQSCIIANNVTYSPILDILNTDPARQITGMTLPDGTKYDMVSFYFKPDGSLDLPATTAVAALSVCSFPPYLSAGNKLPPNYGILHIDRINGRFQVVRP